ncbi:hypothetical protein Lser_V15G21815 [Lactuca serriola]
MGLIQVDKITYYLLDPFQRCLKDLDAFTATIVTRLREIVARDEFRRRKNKAATIVQIS